MTFDHAVAYAKDHINDPMLPPDARKALAMLLGRLRKIDIYRDVERLHLDAVAARALGAKSCFEEAMRTMRSEGSDGQVRLERAMIVICANQPLPAVGAAIHSLTCQDESLRKFLIALDIICYKHTQEALGAVGDA